MRIYCVYLTLYSGNKLPPFYIGSSSIDKIDQGYRGSVSSKEYSKIWNAELTQNFHLFKTKILCTFTTMKEALAKEGKLQRKLNVIKSPLYVNKAIASPNGYPSLDRSGADHPMYGRKHSAKTKAKIAAKRIGTTASPETKAKMSKSHLGEKNHAYGKILPDDIKAKISQSKLGVKWSYEASEETRAKLSEINSGENNHSFGKHWWNNGTKQIRSVDSPGIDWFRGRLNSCRSS